MRPLFKNLETVGARALGARRLLLFLDFDGTLSDIVPDPASARLSRKTRFLLKVLLRRERLFISVISGRSLADVAARVGLSGVVYAGNHGLEIEGRDLSFVEPRAEYFREPIHTVAGSLDAELGGFAGVALENKGLTLSVHYRRSDEALHPRIVEIVQNIARRSGPFRITRGRKVVEIRPPLDWHKGYAVRWIRERVAQFGDLPVYVGDDTTDEDAFRALPDGVTIRVGACESSAAQYGVADVQEVRKFLAWLASLTAAVGRAHAV
jgi:trehalose-phosphatase